MGKISVHQAHFPGSPKVPSPPPPAPRAGMQQPAVAQALQRKSAAPPLAYPQQMAQAKIVQAKAGAIAHTIQMKKCSECKASSGHSPRCSKYVAPVAVTRITKPGTLGTSHSTFSPSGNAVGHGAQSAAGGHSSGKRARQLTAMLANSQK